MYGMTENQEKALKALAIMSNGSSFVAGQACDVLDTKTSDVLVLLAALCALGALECPQTEGLEVPRFRVSRECDRRLSA